MMTFILVMILLVLAICCILKAGEILYYEGPEYQAFILAFISIASVLVSLRYAVSLM